MAPQVFTVFNHGTDFHRDKDPEELITWLSRAARGEEARIVQTGERSAETPLPFSLASPSPSHVICEGPGSDEVSQSQAADGIAHAHPGKYNPIFNTGKGPGESQSLNPALKPTGGKKYWLAGAERSSEFQDHFMGNTPQPRQISGRILGNGWEDNVYKVVWLLTHLKWEAGLPIDTINMLGWSRGAVTCLKMANKLFEVFEDTLNVNIVAIDPVAGGLTPETIDTRTLPPNVRNYLAILALDDDRSNFQPLSRDRVRLLGPKSQHGAQGNPDSLNPQRIRPHVHFLPMPGNHSDLVNSELSSQPVADSAMLCRYLAWKFLTAQGTELNLRLDSDSEELVRCYQRLQDNLEVIARAASSGSFGVVGGYRKERHVRRCRDEYVADSWRYVNEHHRLCSECPSGSDEGEEYFTEPEGSDWGENHYYPLSKRQTSLLKMGF